MALISKSVDSALLVLMNESDMVARSLKVSASPTSLMSLKTPTSETSVQGYGRMGVLFIFSLKIKSFDILFSRIEDRIDGNLFAFPSIHQINISAHFGPISSVHL
jgi:hypothetical protein